MSANEYVLVQGLHATRSTFERWNNHPATILGGWAALSAAIALGLLAAVWAVSASSTPDLTPYYIPGLEGEAGVDNVAGVLFRNSLVLALHATACVAGFIAGASMPIAAAQRSGCSRWVHLKAGQLATFFVGAVTLFSLTTQALALGFQGATISAQLGLAPWQLILSVVPHAFPELVALFLPLAAWLIARRRDEWDQLLAATLVTVVVAIPILVVSALVEVYVWPDIVRAISPLV